MNNRTNRFLALKVLSFITSVLFLAGCAGLPAGRHAETKATRSTRFEYQVRITTGIIFLSPQPPRSLDESALILSVELLIAQFSKECFG